MDDILNFAANNWWLIFPVGAVVGGWFGSLGKYNERRRKDKIELARIKAGAQTEQAKISEARTRDAHTVREQVARVMATQDQVDQRWIGYEMDLATLIDYPLMIDMREPLTLAFHRAKVRAEDLRPESATPDSDFSDIDPVDLEKYRDAVADYRAAFDAAEHEARRRKRTGFSETEREALDRARKLVGVAADDGATPAERQSAYRKARAELDGLIDVPAAASEQIERRIAGALERGHES